MQEAERKASVLQSAIQHGEDQLKEKDVEIKKLRTSAEGKDQKI